MRAWNVKQLANRRHLRLAAPGSPTLGNIENQIHRFRHQTIEKNASAAQKYRVMAAFLQGGCDGIDGLARIILFEPVVGIG
jgi:hypothetical protein